MEEPARKYLMDDEVQKLLVRDASKCDKLLIQLGLTLGCRVSEITSLRIRNIRGRSIKIWDEKKNEHRLCVIDENTASLLRDYLTTDYAVPSGYTRAHQRLFYFSNRTANRKIKSIFADIGIPDDVPHRWHTLRHTYMRMTLDRIGTPRAIQIVSEQTGDTAGTILTIYGVPSIEERMEMAEKYSFKKGGV